MSLKLQAGSLAEQVNKNKLEFRQFANFVQKFMEISQNRFRDVQGAFATAMHNHEIRIKELEAKLAVVPKQELQAELEQIIIQTAERPDAGTEPVKQVTVPVADAPAEQEKSVEQESKVMFHKEYN